MRRWLTWLLGKGPVPDHIPRLSAVLPPPIQSEEHQATEKMIAGRMSQELAKHDAASRIIERRSVQQVNVARDTRRAVDALVRRLGADRE
jgi:hypothetical protein